MGYRATKFKIFKMVKDCDGTPLKFIVKGLKPWSYYVVEVKYTMSNVAHRAIMATSGYQLDGQWYLSDEIEFYSHGYDDVISKRLDNIYWFKVITEIPEMSKCDL